MNKSVVKAFVIFCGKDIKRDDWLSCLRCQRYLLTSGWKGFTNTLATSFKNLMWGVFMRNMVFISLLVTLCGCLLISPGYGAEKVYPFKFAHAQPLTHPRHKSMEFFKQKVEEASQGRIQVEIFGAGILGNEFALLDMVKIGTMQGMRGGLFERVNRKYLLFTLPFLLSDYEQAKRVIRSPFGEKVNIEAKKNGFYVPATCLAGGFRQYTNKVRPIKTPDDMKGLKIRTPAIDTILKTMSALGASPQQVPYTETYMALRTGVVDGQENPYSNIVEMKFYEVQKYLTIVNSNVNPDPLVVNLQWYESLPDDLKKHFDSAAKAAIIYSDQIWLDSEENYRQFLSKKLETNTLSEETRKLFSDKVKSVWQYYVQQGYFTAGEIDEALSIAKGK